MRGNGTPYYSRVNDRRLAQTLPVRFCIHYPALPAIDHVGPEVTEAHVDLQLGSRGGDDPNVIFGDIRGVQAASDGTIFVLDYQAIEVRVFSPDGEFLRTIVRQGEGPGEVREANGIVLSGDTLLWVNDHGQWVVVGVDPAGEELRRFAKPIRSYGYIWDGMFDRQGRYWRQDEHADDEELVDEETGPYEELFRAYYKSYDLSTEEVDSVYTGESTYRGGWGTEASIRAARRISERERLTEFERPVAPGTAATEWREGPQLARATATSPPGPGCTAPRRLAIRPDIPLPGTSESYRESWR